MRFRDLYETVAGQQSPPIRFEQLRQTVNAHHKQIGRVDVYYVQYPTERRDAFYRLAEGERTTPYDDDFTVAEIVCCEGLKEHPHERRYACTKELMHVFDTDEQLANTREKFVSLMKEIQNKPLQQHASAMFQSEIDTRWMAAIVLCPKPLRDQYVAQYRNNALADFDIAEIFRIPEWIVSFIMDDYYDIAFDSLLSD